jgi:hypothetical protein
MDTGESRFTLELRVRSALEQRLGTALEKRRLVVGVASDGRQRLHEFDGVSPDSKTVVEIKTNELKATQEKPDGRYFSAIKWALIGDLYMLSRVQADTKLLVLTDRPLFEICARDMDGLLPPNTDIVFCEGREPAAPQLTRHPAQ